MKFDPAKKALTFGEFIMAAYDAWGKPQAKGIVWLAVNAQLVEFRGPRRFVISEWSTNSCNVHEMTALDRLPKDISG